MKKLLIILTALLTMVACSQISGPQYVANKFFDLLEEGKTKEAKLYATSKTSNIVSMVFNDKDLSDTNFEVKDCITNGNKSICTLVVTNLVDQEEQVMDISMIKQEGNWLVDISKDMLGDKDKMMNGMQNMSELLEE